MVDDEMIPCLAFVGRSRSGKTTLLERLISELRRRGYRIAAIKHTAHPVEPDAPGKDTWRFAQAGAAPVILAAPETPLEEALAGAPDADLALIEGYKRADVAKIEVQRGGGELACAGDARLEAVVSDYWCDLGVPRFDPEDVTGLADWIEERFLRKAE